MESYHVYRRFLATSCCLPTTISYLVRPCNLLSGCNIRLCKSHLYMLCNNPRFSLGLLSFSCFCLTSGENIAHSLI
jgi:hypothetical protein